jgi:hypothetical protein
MTRLLLCTATILALTVSANAQRESGNYMPNLTLYCMKGHPNCFRRAAPPCVGAQCPSRPQRIKQPRR